VNVGRRLVVVVTGIGLIAPRMKVGVAANAVALADCNKVGIEWVRRLTSRGAITIGGMAATADGGLVVAGEHWGDLRVELPGAPERPPQGTLATTSGFLLRLAADGSVRWQRSIPGIEGVSALAVRPDGTILVGGNSKLGHHAALEGPPAVPFPGEDRSPRLLVGFYGDDGTPRAAWSVGTVSAGKERFGSATLTELAADKDRIVIAGTVFGVLDLGAGARKRTLAAAGGADIFVAALENDGAPAWAVRAGGAQSDAPGPLAIGRDGAVSISGRTSNDGRGPGPGRPDPVTVGEGSAPALSRTGHLDALVGQIDRRGRPIWTATVGGDEPWGLIPPERAGAVKPLVQETIAGVVALPNGETLFAGNAALPAVFDGKALLPARAGATAGSFLARVSAAGKLVAAAALGSEHATAMAAAPGGDLVVAGELEGVTIYPVAGPKQVTMTGAGREDVFVARHASDGTLRWAARLGGRGHDRAERIAVDARGAVTVAARFDEGFTIGDQVCDVAPPEYPPVVELIRFAPGASFVGDDPRERRLAAERAAALALKDEAERAFKDQRYADACAAYQKMAAARPDSGAPQADLGLCLQRLGKRKEAIAANRKAIALGARTELADAGEPSARRHAYFNLYKLGVRAGVPKKGCRKLPAAPGCRRSLWVCVGDDHSAGSRMETNSTFARIGVSRDAATIDKGDEQERYHDSTAPDDQRDHVDVTISEELYSFCHEGDDPQCGADDGLTTCEIVTADACLGLIGTVCPDADKKENGTRAARIEETRLRPAQ
jgi:hypothetical protein